MAMAMAAHTLWSDGEFMATEGGELARATSVGTGRRLKASPLGLNRIGGPRNP
ncbi:MAG: hypothetical protein HYY64_14865 [Candidatus Rokubacteria bacterium]|nr:hypothetical protein [Candidatus Rokubacteria bacterium]